MNDFRYGLRGLLRNPAFTVIAVLTLALGIGASTTIFSVLNTVLLRPLPYPDAERIVLLWGAGDAERGQRNQVSFTDSADWREQSTVFEELATFSSWRPILSGDGDPERVAAAQVADGFFRVLGGHPQLGRVFLPEEQIDGNDRVAVISHGLWQRRFGADPDVVGATIHLNLVPYEIVGVMAPEFQSLPRGLLVEPADVYRPLAEVHDENMRSARHLRAIARLQPGVEIEGAQAEMNVIAAGLTDEHPASNAGYDVHVIRLQDDIRGPVRPALILLFGAVLFVLLIVCANVSNLLLVRSAARQREVAIRAALGGSRAALIRQFLTESMMLATLGGVLGLLLTMWSVGLVETLGASVHPALGDIRIEPLVLGFAGLVSLLCGVVFGLAPAWHASRPDPAEALKEGARGLSAGRKRQRTGAVLVVTELALATVLLAGAGLLVQSVRELQRVDPGFDAAGKLVMDIWLPWKTYSEGAKQVELYTEVERRITALPGVESVGVVSTLPVGGSHDRIGVEIEGQVHQPRRGPSPDRFIVSPGYFKTMSIELLEGRYLEPGDRAAGRPVVLISQTMAEQIWPGAEPIGRRLRLPATPTGPRAWRTVVGVVRDVKEYGLDRPGTMQIYLPMAQFPSGYMSLVARVASGEPAALASSVRATILGIDSNLPVFNVTTMEQVLAASISLRRFSMLLLVSFAFTALLLSAVGVYGVIAFTVATRIPEIGVRMALGAQRHDVLRLVMGQGVRLAVVGLSLGLAATWPLTRLLESLLFAITPTDPLTLALTATVLAIVALAACWLPANRALRVDPMESLRG